MYLFLTKSNYRSFQKFEDTIIRKQISEMSIKEKKETKIVEVMNRKKSNSDYLLCLFDEGRYAVVGNEKPVPSEKPCMTFWVNKLDVLSAWQYDIPVGETVYYNNKPAGRIKRRHFLPNGIYYEIADDGEMKYINANELKPYYTFEHHNSSISEDAKKNLIQLAVNIWLS